MPLSKIEQSSVNSGVAGTGPAFAAIQSVGTTLSNNAYTKVLFANELYDTNNNFASSAFTPTVAGYYQINATVGLVNGQTTRTRLALYKNGTQYAGGTDSNTGYVGGTLSSLVYLNGTTDYVEVYVYQNSGSTQNTSSASYDTQFSGALVKAA